jgi:ADP-ribose pyrophosphatase
MAEDRGTMLGHEEIFRGRIFTVSRDRVRLPKGVEATLEVVRHPGSVVLLPLPDPGHVILVKQYRYAIDRWVWELAAGSLEPGEDPAEGAARECEEETGLAAGRVEFLGAFYPTPGYCDEIMNFFKLTGLAVPAGRPGVPRRLLPDAWLLRRDHELLQTHRAGGSSRPAGCQTGR